METFSRGGHIPDGGLFKRGLSRLITVYCFATYICLILVRSEKAPDWTIIISFELKFLQSKKMIKVILLLSNEFELPHAMMLI